ncbi:MAG: glutaredoxin family protein [Solirubrobacteraceae bacterium]
MTAGTPNASPITVYTTEPCSFCARVKGLLSAKGLEFSEVNLSKDPAGRVELAGRTGMMTFPQVLVGDQLLGGFAETLSALQDGRLDELLAA